MLPFVILGFIVKPLQLKVKLISSIMRLLFEYIILSDLSSGCRF